MIGPCSYSGKRVLDRKDYRDMSEGNQIFYRVYVRAQKQYCIRAHPGILGGCTELDMTE